MMTSNYSPLAARFGEVRRSWKRAAALSGLAIVVTESVGILTVLLFLDWLYRPRPLARVVLWAAALGGVCVLFARHVVAPLLRKIPDDQIALYMEEHCRELDGVLITAAEYGRKSGEAGSGQAALIDAVVREAVARARGSARRVIDFSRLRKYGAAAVAGVVVYFLLVMVFPQAVGRHVGRVLTPWHATEEDLAVAPGTARIEPIRFSFSKGDARLARGASFEFEVSLSRAADRPVSLNFRPRAGSGQWQTLPMSEIEKLNGFQGALADVSEDLEYQVVCGEAKSEVHRVEVFDPLVVQSLEVTTHYPAYTKLADRVENPSSGDVEALAGSTVTVRIFASTPLKGGKIKWGDGRTQDLAIDPQTPAAASASFEAKEDAAYDYRIADVNGQETGSPASLSVHVVADAPPSLKVNSPKSPCLTNPLGEVVFDAQCGDDIGVASAEAVYSRLDAKGQAQETRVPLSLSPDESKDALNGVRATGRLLLEELQPPLKPEEALTCHLEVRDSKGQLAVSEIGLIVVGYFETWATWNLDPAVPEGPHPDEGPDLLAMLKAVWTLHAQKTTLAPDDFQTQSRQMADLMSDKKSGELRDFVNLVRFPQLRKAAPQITLHAKNAREALRAADTAKASMELSTAAALAEGGKLLEDTLLAEKNTTAPQATGNLTSDAPMLTLLEQARMEALAANSSDKAHSEKEQNDAAAAADTAKGVEKLMARQDEILAKSKSQASSANLAGSQKELAGKTKELAEKTRQAGSAAAGAKQAGEKASEASRLMSEAAAAFAANRKGEGETKAAAARKKLEEAHAGVSNTNRDKLGEAIAEAESRASAILDAQRDFRKKTETLAVAMGNQAADQGQARDLQALALDQTKLHGQAEALETDIGNLSKLAEQSAKPEVLRSLSEAMRAIKRGQPERKMANAIVDLGQKAPAPAAQEQKNAEDGLEKIVASLRNGDDALASSKAARLAQALRNALAAKKSLAEVAGTKSKSGEAPGKESKSGEAPGKESKSGEAPGKESKSGEAPGKGSKAGEAAGASTKPGAVAQLAHDLRRLAAGLSNRDMVNQKDIDRLNEISKDKEELEKSLVADPKLLEEVSGIVGTISQKLETENAAKSEAGKLFSSQREDCPPAYRQFVNQYFEALSELLQTSGASH
ncbi:MAG: hypothetical protein PHQ12_02020 [Chthoniobacteraceae bacterium]|nr:hypothetical protein [Chthoniobacteraceae bacterium]